MIRKLGFLALPLTAAAAASIAVGACGSDSGSDDGDGAGGDAQCKPTASICYVNGPDGPGADCLAKRDNSTASSIQLRVSQLVAKSPNALTQPFMQDSIITRKITLNQAQCFQFGDAQYNWLFDIDEAGGTMTSGGGIPQALIGPAEDGTCFANFVDPTGIQVNATTVSASDTTPGGSPRFSMDGSKVSATFPRTIIPIYIDDSRDNYALLPVNELKVDMTLSADKSCVGRFAHERLRPEDTCKAGDGEFAWENAASFEGYITVEEADAVQITSLGFTLCVLLSQDTNKWKGPPDPRFTDIGSCATSDAGKMGELPEGDWCSTNDDSCTDSWKLTGDFAAAAIDITGDCD